MARPTRSLTHTHTHNHPATSIHDGLIYDFSINQISRWTKLVQRSEANDGNGWIIIARNFGSKRKINFQIEFIEFWHDDFWIIILDGTCLNYGVTVWSHSRTHAHWAESNRKETELRRRWSRKKNGKLNDPSTQFRFISPHTACIYRTDTHTHTMWLLTTDYLYFRSCIGFILP